MLELVLHVAKACSIHLACDAHKKTSMRCKQCKVTLGRFEVQKISGLYASQGRKTVTYFVGGKGELLIPKEEVAKVLRQKQPGPTGMKGLAAVKNVVEKWSVSVYCAICYVAG